MIIYFAGNGRKAELSKKLCEHENKEWGVLLSYKDIQTKDKKGCLRFKNLIKNKK